MILEAAQQIAEKYNMAVWKNEQKNIILESNKNPDIDYCDFSRYQFKKLYQSEFSAICQDYNDEWHYEDEHCYYCDEYLEDCECED